jgi:hypothetical protein
MPNEPAFVALVAALSEAGFPGVEVAVEDGQPVIYARGDGPSAHEFRVTQGAGPAAPFVLAMRFSVRAPQAGMRDWMLRHPAGRMDIDCGETRLTMCIPGAAPQSSLPAMLADWRAMLRDAAIATAEWRRTQRSAEPM